MQVKYCSAACSRVATILQNRLLAFSCSFHQGCELFFSTLCNVSDDVTASTELSLMTKNDSQVMYVRTPLQIFKPWTWGGPCWIRFSVSPDLLGNAQVTNNTSHLSSCHSFVALGHLRWKPTSRGYHKHSSWEKPMSCGGMRNVNIALFISPFILRLFQYLFGNVLRERHKTH